MLTSELSVIDQILSLHRNKIAGHYAPHKPVLLLAVADLFEDGSLHSNRIELTDHLKDAFYANWKKFVGHSLFFKPTVTTPFCHMGNEPFWELRSITDKPVDMSIPVYSEGKLRSNYYVVIDEMLRTMLADKDCRALIRHCISSCYFADNKKASLPGSPSTLLSLIVPVLLSIAS